MRVTASDRIVFGRSLAFYLLPGIDSPKELKVIKTKISLIAVLTLLLAYELSAATFVFNSSTNSMNGLAVTSLTDDGFTMTLAAGPAGAVLDDVDAQGLGINSRGIPGAVDDDATKFNVIEGTSPVSGQGESAEFSFDRAGILTALDFDGVKDELFEYFRLDTGSGEPIYFFDSMADPAGINVDGMVIFLQESATLDDEISGLSIPFSAGQVLTLSYGQLGAGNGSRWEGLTVAVPEPNGLALLLFLVLPLKRRFSRCG